MVESLVYRINMLTIVREGRWGAREVGIQEDTCPGDHWVLHVGHQSRRSLPETSVLFCVNPLEFK